MTNSKTYLVDEGPESFEEPWVGFVHCDLEILSGTPVFVGTRLPVENITASLEQGVGRERVLKEYPFLTSVHIDAAIAYAAKHPISLPRRRLGEANPGWILTSSKVVRLERKLKR